MAPSKCNDEVVTPETAPQETTKTNNESIGIEKLEVHC